MSDATRSTSPDQASESHSPDLVDSLRHPLAIEIRDLLTREGRIRRSQIIIDDEENIVQALRAGVRVRGVFHAGDDTLSEDLRALLPPETSVHEVAKRTSKKLFGTEKMSRLFAIADAPAPIDLEAMVATQGDLVVLDDVSIAGNVGAIVRTSLALGLAGMILLDCHAHDVWDRRLIRASRGLVFSLPIVVTTLQELVSFCSAHAIRLLVTTMNAPMSVTELPTMADRLAIAFGSEKRGCSPALLDAAELQIRIPIDPRVESLNVSAAAGIVLFHRRSLAAE